MQFSYIVAWILRQWRKMKGTSLRGKLKYGFTYFLSGISFKFVIRDKTTVESRSLRSRRLSLIQNENWALRRLDGVLPKQSRNLQCPDFKCWQDCLMSGEIFVIIVST